MKFLLGILIFCFSVHLSYGIEKEQAKEMYMAALNKCKASIPVSEGDFEKVKLFELPETRDGKCFAACLMKTTAFMNAADNKVNKAIFMIGIEIMYEHSPEDSKKCEEVIDGCLDVTDADECEAAFKVATCLKAGREARGIVLSM